MQHGKQPFWARLQLFARLTLNAGKHPANQPARLAQLDDGNDRPVLVQGHEGPAQIVRLGHRGTPSIDVSGEIAILAARPIASLRARDGAGSPCPLPVVGRGSLGFWDLGRWSGPVGGALECGDVDALHLHHPSKVRLARSRSASPVSLISW